MDNHFFCKNMVNYMKNMVNLIHIDDYG